MHDTLITNMQSYVYIQPEVISNMPEFKRSLPLFPLVKPHVNFMAAKL